MKTRKGIRRVLAAVVGAAMMFAAIPAQASGAAVGASITAPMGWQMGTGASAYWGSASEWDLGEGVKAVVNHYSGNLAVQFANEDLKITYNLQDDIGDPVYIADKVTCNYTQKLYPQADGSYVLSDEDGSKSYFVNGVNEKGYTLQIDRPDCKYAVTYQGMGVQFERLFNEEGLLTVYRMRPNGQPNWVNLSETTYRPGYSEEDPSVYIESIKTLSGEYTFYQHNYKNRQITEINKTNGDLSENFNGFWAYGEHGSFKGSGSVSFNYRSVDFPAYDEVLENITNYNYADGKHYELNLEMINVNGIDRIASVEYVVNGVVESKEQYAYGNNQTVIISKDGSVKVVRFNENGQPIA